MNQLLTVNSVAKILSVSVRTVCDRLGGFYPVREYAQPTTHLWESRV